MWRRGGGDGYGGFAPYVPVAERRRQAAAKMKQLAKGGAVIEPVTIEGRTIAKTVWGNAWCTHLERFSDYASRLPRGRAYLRNGSVVHLGVAAGKIDAYVQGSELYTVAITMKPLARAKWDAIARACAGKIDSLVELLAGKLSAGVMAVMTARDTGLFPHPNEITLSCSCPDVASMCKHVAATLYGLGARFDARPELLFVLRGVDQLELIRDAGTSLTATKKSAGDDSIAASDLGDIFGIEIDAGATEVRPVAAPSASKRSKKRETAKTISLDALVERGVSRRTVSAWVKRGWLVATKRPDHYRLTPDSEARLAER